MINYVLLSVLAASSLELSASKTVLREGEETVITCSIPEFVAGNHDVTHDILMFHYFEPLHFLLFNISGTPFDWLKGMTGSSANPIKFASSLQLEEKYKATVSADFSLDAGETSPFLATLTISSKTTR